MDEEDAVLSLKLKRDPGDRRPLIATIPGSGEGAEPPKRDVDPARRKSHDRAGEGLPMGGGKTVVMRLKHKRDPRDRIPLVPSKRELERGVEPT